MSALIDLTGQKFGRWTVLERAESTSRKQTRWLCQCECGTKRMVVAAVLRKGHSKSCGCLINEKVRPPKGQASFNKLYSGYKRHAKERGLVFALSKEQFAKLTKQNCYYCGTSPSNINISKRMYGSYIYNGVDRIDNTQGYLPENCVPCCKMCNRMKLNYPYMDFIEHIKRIFYHSV